MENHFIKCISFLSALLPQNNNYYLFSDSTSRKSRKTNREGGNPLKNQIKNPNN